MSTYQLGRDYVSQNSFPVQFWVRIGPKGRFGQDSENGSEAVAMLTLGTLVLGQCCGSSCTFPPICWLPVVVSSSSSALPPHTHTHYFQLFQLQDQVCVDKGHQLLWWVIIKIGGLAVEELVEELVGPCGFQFIFMGASLTLPLTTSCLPFRTPTFQNGSDDFQPKIRRTSNSCT